MNECIEYIGSLLIFKNILDCVCVNCNKALVYKNENEISKLLKNKRGNQRYFEIRSMCKRITHCQKN